MPNDAASWLLSLTPQLQQLRAERAAESQLHAAHVEAWMTADCCQHCGSWEGVAGYRCARCREERHVEALRIARAEEADYRAMVERF